MTLYNCRSTPVPDQYRITKFDDDLNPEATYVVSKTQCQCPAAPRPTCRHRQMLPEFIARDRINGNWACEYNRGTFGWRQLIGPLDEALGEPTLPFPPPTADDSAPSVVEAPEAHSPAAASGASPLWRRPL